MAIRRFGDGRDWFFEKRFGMFVHWGVYALPAWHEQILWRGNWKREDYEKLSEGFNPGDFDPDEWLDLLQAAGMEYLCFTSKHHDGFCMWDSAFTDYKVTNTRFGKDVLAMVAEACERRGVLFGLYYSLPDWHHPNYPNLGRHHEMFGPRTGDEPDEHRYLEYVRNQVRELCTDYGRLCQFFWDVNVAEFHDPSLNQMVRELQPDAVINDRGPSAGDFSTPERHVPEGLEFSHPTQACQSMGRESWGYREGESYFSHKYLMQSIDRTLAMGGSYLLNVGPTADGNIPEECRSGLERIGDWFTRVREGFDDALPCSHMVGQTTTHLTRYERVFLTRRGNVLYVHLPEDPQTTTAVLEGFEVEPEAAVLLNDGRELPFVVDTIPWRWTQKPCLRINDLPVNEISDEVMIIKMAFAESTTK